MKKNELTKVVFAALVLASSSVLAESDYPAADFQPKVVFSDESAQGTTASKSTVVAPSESTEAADPNFPAANYQPKVLYSDAGYKHSSAAPSASGPSTSASSVKSSSSSMDGGQVEQPASSNFSLIGLIVLAAAGFFVYSKKSGGKLVKAAAQNYSVSSEGATGVEKYLEKVGANKTGVAKYLEKQTENPSTGVAKYMAKQIVKDREIAAARATGVEKYLRDKS